MNKKELQQFKTKFLNLIDYEYIEIYNNKFIHFYNKKCEHLMSYNIKSNCMWLSFRIWMNFSKKNNFKFNDNLISLLNQKYFKKQKLKNCECSIIKYKNLKINETTIK